MSNVVEGDRSVYADIEDERDHQRAIGYTEEHDDRHSPSDFLGFIGDQRLKAAACVSTPPTPGEVALLRERYVKVAALAVAALESIDRKAGR